MELFNSLLYSYSENSYSEKENPGGGGGGDGDGAGRRCITFLPINQITEKITKNIN